MSTNTVVSYYGLRGSSSCGYCKTDKDNRKYGLWLHQVTARDYQTLIDRSWRRSGSYCYRPAVNYSCCPLYTIRCSATQLQLTRSQKKTIKRMNKYLIYNERKRLHGSNVVTDAVCEFEPPVEEPRTIAEIQISLEIDPVEKRVENVENVEECQAAPPAKSLKLGKRRTMRFERAIEKRMNKGVSREVAVAALVAKHKPNPRKTIEELLDEPKTRHVAHDLVLRLVATKSPEFDETFDAEFTVYHKYQTVVHNECPETCTPNSFRQFLVRSPIMLQRMTGPVSHYGSYHQQYWMDGRLIAVGVLDVLPQCVSSVYLFYDPEFSDFGLGTYSAMRELELVREIGKYDPEMKYYYMGFYIDTCPKMKYKGRIKPSFLLCPEVYSWHLLSKCNSKVKVLGRLNEDPNEKDKDEVSRIEEILMLFDNTVMRYETYLATNFGIENMDRSMVIEYANVVGNVCTKSVVLKGE